MIGSARKGRRRAETRPAVRPADRRAAKLSAARRREIARKAALTRQAGKKPAALGASVPSVEDIAADLTRDIPREVWNRLPADLIDQLDHYLYGWPRR